jgi:hypothetical protein
VTGPGRPGVPTVREVLTRHLDAVMPQRNRAPLTIRSYRSLCEQQVYPRWGGQRIDRLSARDIEDGLAAMSRDGLAASTRRKVLAILSSVLEIEARRGIIARNPCALVEGPRLGKPDKTRPDVIAGPGSARGRRRAPQCRPLVCGPGSRLAAERAQRAALAVCRPRHGRHARLVPVAEAALAARLP